MCRIFIEVVWDKDNLHPKFRYSRKGNAAKYSDFINPPGEGHVTDWKELGTKKINEANEVGDVTCYVIPCSLHALSSPGALMLLTRFKAQLTLFSALNITIKPCLDIVQCLKCVLNNTRRIIHVHHTLELTFHSSSVSEAKGIIAYRYAKLQFLPTSQIQFKCKILKC